jgi:predicted ATP-grasp superfamily ATP-dependent carboligase
LNGEGLRILVTDGDYKHTLGIVRCLAGGGHAVYVASIASRCLSGFSRYCAGVLVTCNWHQDNNEQAYIDQLGRHCLDNHIDLVIPVGYKNCELISKHKIKLEGITRMLIADYEQIRFAADKARVLQLADALSISIPVTYYPVSMSELPSIAGGMKYPCVIKSRYEHGINVIAYPNSAEDLQKKYVEIVDRYKFTNGDLPMVQEYISGSGCGFFALYINGVCRRVFMHKRLREFPVTGGASVKCVSIYDRNLLDAGTKLLDALKWHGVAMVEFKRDREGNYYLMEINPKYWGSTELAIASGLPFPLLTVQYIGGEDIPYSEHYDSNIIYHWPLNGDLLHGLHRPGRLGSIILDCLNYKVKSNLWPSDYKVNAYLLARFVVDVKNYVAEKLFH